MDFLYLFDVICSFLGFELQGNKPSIWINQFDQRTHGINGGVDNIIWAYDEVDDYFTKAWRYYEEGDYYHLLSMEFECSKDRSGITLFYVEKWFKYIGEYITKRRCIRFFYGCQKYRESVLNNNLN